MYYLLCTTSKFLEVIFSTSRNSTEEDSGITEETYKQAINLLQLVKTSCSRSSEASALFMDELATVIKNGDLDPKVEVYEITSEHLMDILDHFSKQYLKLLNEGNRPKEITFVLYMLM